MDPVTTLYERLRQRSGGTLPVCVEQPPLLEDWLRHWNDDATDLINLRNLEHWLCRSPALRTDR